MPSEITCPYCGKPAVFYPSSAGFYDGRDYGPVYACVQCDARVGCHRGTVTPLGRLANAELRKAKIMAHNAFDWMWKSGMFSRTRSYKWLSNQLEIEPEKCHIGMFDVDQCRQVAEVCTQRMRAEVPHAS